MKGKKSIFPPPAEAPPFAVKKIVRRLRNQRNVTSSQHLKFLKTLPYILLSYIFLIIVGVVRDPVEAPAGLGH